VTDRRNADTVPLNPPDPERNVQLRQLEGEEDRDDQDAVLDAAEIEERPDALSHTEVYEGELEAQGAGAVPAGVGSLEGLASLDLREGETANPHVAAEEGETWIPPVDPPVVANADAEGGITVAAGFGSTALDEPFDADHHGTALSADDEVSARVREALLADSRTSRLANLVGIDTEAGVVTIRGTVEDIDDGDLLAEVATEVSGVTEVRDETEIPGL
jgi:osmotically-inducible protein OsmY